MQKSDNRPRPAFVYALLISLLFGAAFKVEVPEQRAAVERVAIAPAAPVAAPVQALPDFAAINDISEKKQTFFDFLQPYIDAKNTQILRQRLVLLGIVEKMAVGYVLNHREVSYLYELSTEYGVATEDVRDPAFLERLLHRVDVIPPSLVLAQAANESGWGTSRFAQQGYNLFGQWCYRQGCGLVPLKRLAKARHEVKSFGSIEEAVNAYFLNINTFANYQYLRLLRQELRREAKPIEGLALVEGLRGYSERGDAYIRELRSLIRHNDLQDRDHRQLIY